MENILEAVRVFKERQKQWKSSSPPPLETLKATYDEYLRQQRELEAFLDDPDIPTEEREKKLPEFKTLLKHLNQLIAQIEELGYPMTREILNGFVPKNKTNFPHQQEVDTPLTQLGALALPKDFELNDEFRKGVEAIENTKNNLYITGEAGTGKTTLLSYWRQNTKKNFVVLAPTGIAAVNSGGQTIHSFFKFPPRLVQREDVRKLSRMAKIFETLDTLVVDESSMMRADLADAIDCALRVNREAPHLLFGGVQVIFFGDLFQLPPIVDRELGPHYGELYETPYFFSANVFKETRFHQFCLKKNYRQRDKEFVSLLNKIRNGKVSESDLRKLNSCVNPKLAESLGNAIRLVPTNAAANSINQARLAKLPGKEFLYEAVIRGEFDEASYPTETRLRLKIGAQVLMIKNDLNGRWVNGSLGQVVELQPDSVRVKIDHGIHDVRPEIWPQIRYGHDEATNRIVSEIVGTFEQFPMKLAWAITIHKSQGLTLDRVIIDFDNGCFAHGQAYVALTRCRSFEGLVLKRPVHFSDLIFDKRIHRISDLFIPIEL